MLTAVLEQAVVFRKIIDAIKDLVPQVNIEASKTGLSIQAMDSAHVSLVSLCLHENGFTKYRCDETITLGINLNDLSKILKMAQNDDRLTLSANNEESYLTISFENKKNGRESECQLNLLTLESDSLGIPDTEYPTKIAMSSNEFFRICKELTALSDTIQIEVNNKEALLRYSGKTGKGTHKLKNTSGEKEDDSITIKCEEEVNAKYGLQYLNSFSKGSSLSNKVEINLSASFPMMINYEIENLGFVKFYLAPKMEDDQ